MNNLLTLILVALSALSLFSCESFYFATITNDSPKVVTLKITYKATLENTTKGKRVEVTQLNPEESYTVTEESNRVKPTFETIDELEIYTQDSVLLKTKRMFLPALFGTDRDLGIYELKIR